ncbi:MAG: hypothetical protein FJ098_01385, partial [Deltaproteobacteria bacterium]|nr:hypothetical protein [Deltaproteobacteria bacterium]
QISSMTLAAGGILSQTTAQVLYPRMSREFGRTGDAGAALRLATRPLLALALLGLPVVALGWALLPPFVGWLLPRYLPGVQAAQWSLLSVYLLYLTPTLNLYPVTGRLSAYLAVVLLSAGAFLAAVPWRLAASPGDPLAGMAQAMAAGVAVFAGAGNVGALLLARWGRPVPGPRA